MTSTPLIPARRRVIALLDDRPGNNSQTLGVAEALDIPYESVELHYNSLVRLHNRLLSLGGLPQLSVESRAKLKTVAAAGGAPVILSAGRRMAPAAAWLKSRLPGAFACQMMDPGMPYAPFDLVVIPEHDGPRTQAGVMPVALPPHRVTRARLAAEAEPWREAFAALPRPRVGVLTGGSNKRARFGPRDCEKLGQALEDLLAVAGGSLLVTTSRRTDPELLSMLETFAARWPGAVWLHRWSSQGANPYSGILAWADILAVTGDSVSMCAEALMPAKPLFLFLPEALRGTKFDAFAHSLYHQGAARPLLSRITTDWQPEAMPLAATLIAGEIRKRAALQP